MVLGEAGIEAHTFRFSRPTLYVLLGLSYPSRFHGDLHSGAGSNTRRHNEAKSFTACVARNPKPTPPRPSFSVCTVYDSPMYRAFRASLPT